MLLIIMLVVFIGLMLLSVHYDSEGAGGFSAICIIIIVILCFIVPIESYDSYVDLRVQYEGVVAQYGQSITMYEDRAIININEKTFTDLRYQGYQEQLGKFISELRTKVTSYNASYISKSIYNENILWCWLIFGPDEDMKLLQLNEQVGER